MKSIRTQGLIRWLPVLSTVVLACFLVVTHVRLYPYAFDDAYIQRPGKHVREECEHVDSHLPGSCQF